MLLEVPRLEQTQDLSVLRFWYCMRLKAVEVFFHRIECLETIEFIECQAMEAFPMEGQASVMEQLRKRPNLPRRYPLARMRKPSLKVNGSKFASLEMMQTWLRVAELGSPLFVGAVVAVMYQCVNKDTREAFDTLSSIVGIANEVDPACFVYFSPGSTMIPL